jgi:hypothetical protein
MKGTELYGAPGRQASGCVFHGHHKDIQFVSPMCPNKRSETTLRIYNTTEIMTLLIDRLNGTSRKFYINICRLHNISVSSLFLLY